MLQLTNLGNDIGMKIVPRVRDDTLLDIGCLRPEDGRRTHRNDLPSSTNFPLIYSLNEKSVRAL